MLHTPMKILPITLCFSGTGYSLSNSQTEFARCNEVSVSWTHRVGGSLIDHMGHFVVVPSRPDHISTVSVPEKAALFGEILILEPLISFICYMLSFLRCPEVGSSSDLAEHHAEGGLDRSLPRRLTVTPGVVPNIVKGDILHGTALLTANPAARHLDRNSIVDVMAAPFAIHLNLGPDFPSHIYLVCFWDKLFHLEDYGKKFDYGHLLLRALTNF